MNKNIKKLQLSVPLIATPLVGQKKEPLPRPNIQKQSEIHLMSLDSDLLKMKATEKTCHFTRSIDQKDKTEKRGINKTEYPIRMNLNTEFISSNILSVKKRPKRHNSQLNRLPASLHESLSVRQQKKEAVKNQKIESMKKKIGFRENKSQRHNSIDLFQKMTPFMTSIDCPFSKQRQSQTLYRNPQRYKKQINNQFSFDDRLVKPIVQEEVIKSMNKKIKIKERQLRLLNYKQKSRYEEKMRRIRQRLTQ